MLLSSGQISLAISSGVVCIFTSLLFLSGYVLQQQTVRSLQIAIRPPASPQPTQSADKVTIKHFKRPQSNGFYDKFLASNRPKGGWNKVAYVQLLRSHDHVCNAVMAFATLEEQESMAQRVILYPREWDDENLAKDGSALITQRLLRDASNNYKVFLQPIDPLAQLDNMNANTSYSEEELYPLTNLLSVFTYNRIIYLQPSGVILDASPLDSLFTLPMEDRAMIGLKSPLASTADRAGILLIQPSSMLYQSTLDVLPEGAYPDLDFWALVPTIAANSPSSSDPSRSMDESRSQVLRAPSDILAESSGLHNVEASFRPTEFLQTTGYVHFQDEGLLGPEYATPRAELLRAAPARREARVAWEGIYEKYRTARMDVCGLDLKPLPLSSHTGLNSPGPDEAGKLDNNSTQANDDSEFDMETTQVRTEDHILKDASELESEAAQSDVTQISEPTTEVNNATDDMALSIDNPIDSAEKDL